MKLVKTICLSLFLNSVAFAGMKEAKVSVNGMVCGFCAQGITKKFKAEPAIETVDVNLGQKLVKLTFKEKQNLADEKITGLLKDAGYNVDKIERN